MAADRYVFDTFFVYFFLRKRFCSPLRSVVCWLEFCVLSSAFSLPLRSFLCRNSHAGDRLSGAVLDELDRDFGRPG